MMSSSLIAKCYYRVSDKPSNPEAFQNISTQYHNTTMLNFEIKLCVRFIQRCSHGFGHVINIPSSPLSSHYISVKEFFQNGLSFLRRNLSHHLLEPRVLNLLIPNIIGLARRCHNDNIHPYPSRFEDRFVAIPLVIDVVVELRENVNLVDVMDDDHMHEIRMIPTCEEGIQSLNKMKSQEEEEDDDDDSNDEKINECCICFDEFCDNEEVSMMPCDHVFHYSCIVRWLKTSHLCPLCRYPMPVNNNS